MVLNSDFSASSSTQQYSAVIDLTQAQITSEGTQTIDRIEPWQYEEEVYDINSEREYSIGTEEEKDFEIEDEEEYSTDSKEELDDNNLEDGNYDDSEEVEDYNELFIGIEASEKREKVKSTVVDESHSFFEGFHGKYGPYFQNFTSTMLFTWISKHMICGSTIFFKICIF